MRSALSSRLDQVQTGQIFVALLGLVCAVGTGALAARALSGAGPSTVVFVVGGVLATGAVVVAPRWGGFAVFVLLGLSANNSADILGASHVLYSQRGAARLSVADAAIGVLCLAALARETRKRPICPELILVALVFGLAIVGGLVVGVSNQGSAYVVQAKTCLYFIAVPVAFCVLSDGEGRIKFILNAAMAIGLLKALLGLVNVITSAGVVISGTSLSYYDPGPLLVILVAVLLALVELRRRGLVLLPAATLVAGTAALYFSQRRSFWIGTVFAIIVLSVVLAGRHRQEFLLVAGILVAATLVALVNYGGQDFAVLNPAPGSEVAQIHSAVGDEYRNAERKNVVADIESSPIEGIGFGVPWVQKYPLPGWFPLNHDYTHVEILWFWLKMGLLGLIAYLTFFVASVRVAVKAAAGSSPGSPERVFAIVGGTVIATAVILGFTATFAGSDPQYTFVLCAILGITAACIRDPISESRQYVAR